MQTQLQNLLGDNGVGLCHGAALAPPALGPCGIFSHSPFIQSVSELRHFPGVVGWPWLDAGCPPNLLSWAGRENKMKSSWGKIRTGRDPSQLLLWAKQAHLGGISQFITNQIRVG